MSTGSSDTVTGNPSAATIEATAGATRGHDSSGDADQRRRHRFLKQGSVVGRYVVLERIGAGSNGAVYSAFDPKLDRRVALKLLRETRRGASDASELLLEAQAMARLSHPHVVSVHDVGEHEGQVFLAMEFVEGCTLAQWLETAVRPREELLEVFVAAGRGLAAAHDKRLVHRDFKPDNVLVGDDGRVLVGDFGLAQALASLDAPTTAAGAQTEGTPATVKHHFVGTPAYAAPEQHEDAEVGAAADQFSFCVALYEALYAERPFAGATPAEIAYNVTQGRLREPPAQSAVSPWLRRVIVRGLAHDPSARHESMSALLAALRHDPQRRRRRIALVAVAAAILPAGLVANALFAERAEQQCAREGTQIDEDWNDATRAALRESMQGSGVSFADDVSALMIRRLDGFAEAWRSTRAALCRDAAGGESRDRLEASVACLDSARRDLTIVIEVLGASAPESVLGATGVAALLTPPHLCTEGAFLERNPPQPQDEDVRRLGLDLTRARALTATSQWDEARALAMRARDRARDRDLRQVEAAALNQLADIANEQGEPEEAITHGKEAFFLAAAAGADAVAASAAARIAFATGYQQRRFDDGLHWVRLGLLWDERSALPVTVRSDLLNARAVILQAAGDLDRARDDLKAALDLRREVFGPAHPSSVEMLLNLGNLEAFAADVGRARELSNLGRPLAESAFGTEHPVTAGFEELAGNVAQRAGEYDLALEHYNRALHTRTLVLGAKHPAIASTEFNLGTLERALGDLESAAAHYETAFSITEATQTAPSMDLFARTLWLAEVYSALGRSADALAMFERACETEAAIDVTGVAGALTLLQLAELQQDLEGTEPSIATLRRTLDVLTDAGATRSAVNAMVHMSLGWKLVDTGQRDLGFVHVGQALEIVENEQSFPQWQKGPVYTYAGTVELAHGTDERARELLTRARDTSTTEDQKVIHATALNGLGELERRAGRIAPARVLFERALEGCEGVVQAPDCEAASQLGLARIDLVQGDRMRAETRGRRARALLAGLEGGATWLTAEVEAFVSENFE